MMIQLKYDNQVTHQMCGAFVRGNSPAMWLKEISTWGIDPAELICFLIPESISSIKPSGLFVVFRSGDIPPVENILNPYGLFAKKLFLPIHASIFPEVSPEELKSILLWEHQVFHPTIGLIGFEKTDVTDLSKLIHFTDPLERNWRLAHPGIEPPARLQQIAVEKPSPEEMIDSLLEDVKKKPLDEIPQTEKEETPKEKFFNNLKKKLLKKALPIVKKINASDSGKKVNPKPVNIQPGGAGGGGGLGLGGLGLGGIMGGGSSPGFFQRMEKWMTQKLEDIDKKREDEIQRLLKLFDTNTDEALQFAIPLNSPYLNRGTPSTPSTQLGRKDTTFNLGKIGGGGAVDNWNVGSYYNDLRTKYQKAAQKEVENKNFKKAAYIYAHLLNDFHSAANVLKQGKHYREAAALYKEHLKNIPAAADCLEEGGLYLEAIELYVELNKYEKAGDLYKKLEQRENAEKLFQRCIDQSMTNKDYLEASRLQKDKMEDTEKAKETLLKGWNESVQSEACLNKYFDEIASGEKEKLNEEVKNIYVNQTPKTKKTGFLTVLSSVVTRHKDAELNSTSRNIAYEITSEQVAAGNTSSLNFLRNFIPEDRVVPSDVNRFVFNHKAQARMEPPLTVLQLKKEIKWYAAVTWRNQFLAFGDGDGDGIGHVVRGNWKGHFEYNVLNTVNNSAPVYYDVVSDERYSNRIYAHADKKRSIAKTMQDSHHFDNEIILLDSPAWFPKGLLGFCFNGTKGITTLNSENDTTIISHFSMEGSLIKSYDCKLEVKDKTHQPFYLHEKLFGNLILRNDHYYFAAENSLFRISENGFVETLILDTYISKITASNHHLALRIALITGKGCMLLQSGIGEMKVNENIFAADIDAIDIKYIPDNCLVVAGARRTAVYDIQNDIPEKRCIIETDADVVAILETGNRNHCALLEKNGKISIHFIGKKV
jgi:tetratricopeptide (TPR) repeat protein